MSQVTKGGNNFKHGSHRRHRAGEIACEGDIETWGGDFVTYDKRGKICIGLPWGVSQEKHANILNKCLTKPFKIIEQINFSEQSGANGEQSGPSGGKDGKIKDKPPNIPEQIDF